ncbi:hypothetical protein TRVL_05061 [Trypanosoma vivax]|nr:hypothetical protein TRVL_05061 [Trypanosoma vivax]
MHALQQHRHASHCLIPHGAPGSARTTRSRTSTEHNSSARPPHTHTHTRLLSSFASAANPKLHVAVQRGQKLPATSITNCPAAVLTCVNVRLALNRFEVMGEVLLTSDRKPPVNIRNSRYFSCRHSHLFDPSVSLQKHFHTALRWQALARHRRPSSFLLHRTISGIPVSELARCFARRHSLIFTKCHTDLTRNERGHAPPRTNKELLVSNQTKKLRSAIQHPVRLKWFAGC